MENSIVGVNENSVKALILQIDEYREKIQSLTYDLEDLQIKTCAVLNIDGANNVNQKYNMLKNMFQVVQTNLTSYQSDLNHVVKQYTQASLNSLDTLNHYDKYMSKRMEEK